VTNAVPNAMPITLPVFLQRFTNPDAKPCERASTAFSIEVEFGALNVDRPSAIVISAVTTSHSGDVSSSR